MLKRKIVAAVTVTALVLPQLVVCSCSKKDDNKKIYADDVPWYTLEYSDAVSDYADVSDDTITYYLGRSNGNYVFVEEADYPVPEELSMYGRTSSEYHDAKLVMCDNDLNVTGTVDLEVLFGDAGVVDNDSQSFGITDQSYATDEKIVIETYSMGLGYSMTTVTVDPVSLEITDTSNTDDLSFYNEFGVDEKRVMFGNGRRLGVGIIDEGSNCTIVIGIYDDAGDVHFTNMADLLPMVGIYDMTDPLMVDDSHAVAKLKTYAESDDYWISVDIGNNSVSVLDEDMSYLDGIDLDNISYSPEFGSVSLSETGITKIDAAAKTTEEVFSFDWCNLNRSLIDDVKLLGIDEDSIVLFTTETILSRDGKVDYENDLIRLSKCDVNPNVGKTILTVACLDDISDALAQTVCDFNESNEDYYISVTDKYNAADYGSYSSMAVVAAMDDSLEFETAGRFMNDSDPGIYDYSLSAESDMSSGLMVDLISGEGPDIIIDGAGYSQLYSDDMLIDLTTYLQDSGITCLDNIIDVSKVDGKLYQIPLTFTISGMEVDSSSIAPGQTGFTFEQYGEYVSGPCNGMDPMMLTKLDFLTAVIMSQPDLFISDGVIDFDNEAFRAAAEYAADNVFDPVTLDEVYDIQEDYYVGYSEIKSLYGAFFGTRLFEGNSFLGIPSFDGKGPVVNIKCSAGISAQTSSPEGCWEFISMLMEDEHQKDLSYECMPVTSSAFDLVCEEELGDYSDYYYFWSEEERMLFSMPEPSEDQIDTFREIIGTADRINMTDASVMIIMREEIQAYFAGDKTLDEAIGIINNRAQLYYEERR